MFEYFGKTNDLTIIIISTIALLTLLLGLSAVNPPVTYSSEEEEE
jgi:hypothetical protein